MKPEYRALVRYIFPAAKLDHLWHVDFQSFERAGFEIHDV